MARVDLYGVILSCAMTLPACGGGGSGGGDGGPAGPSGAFVLITPYVNSADVATIRAGFSTSATAPWGQAQDGIVFIPAGELRPFQAACAGTVDRVDTFANERTGHWQVNALIKFDDTFAVTYSFSPFSSSPADGQAQRAAILVSAGQRVSAGQLLGRLLVRDNSSNVLFRVLRNYVAVCPEPYFTAEARSSVMAIIQRDHPSWQMCY